MVYTIFTGSDFLLYIKNDSFPENIFGEIEAIKYNTKKKSLSLKVALFPTVIDTFKLLKELNKAHIVQVFTSEYDDKMYRIFDGVTYIGEEGDQDINDDALYTNIVCSFTDISPYSKFEDGETIEDILRIL